MTDKQAVADALQRLPENAPLEEITEELQIMAAIRRGRADAAAGRTKTHEEVQALVSEALQYLTAEDGKKTAVMLPITDYEKLLEDLDDLATVAERRNEPTIPHEQFKAELRRDGI